MEHYVEETNKENLPLKQVIAYNVIFSSRLSKRREKVLLTDYYRFHR